MTLGKFEKEMAIYLRENAKISPFSLCKEKCFFTVQREIIVYVISKKKIVLLGTQNSSELVTSKGKRIAAVRSR